MHSIILILAFSFSVTSLADDPPLPAEYYEIVEALKEDNVETFKSLIEKHPGFKIGPCGNRDIDQDAAEYQAIKILTYIGTHFSKSDRYCAFGSAVRSGKMKSIKYFVEDFKIEFNPNENFLWSIANSCDTNVAKYFFKRFKTSASNAELESGFRSSVFSGCASMVDFFRAKGAKLTNPIYFLKDIANGDNHSSESKMDHDLSFTLATNSKVQLNSKRLLLQSTAATSGVAVKLSANPEKDLKECLIPLLGHPHLTKWVYSYDFNKLACDVIVEPEKASWKLHIYATQISYKDLKLKPVQKANDRSAIDLAPFGKSRWLGEWGENGIRYIAGFSCKEKNQDSCLQESEARKVLSELVLIKK